MTLTITVADVAIEHVGGLIAELTRPANVDDGLDNREIVWRSEKALTASAPGDQRKPVDVVGRNGGDSGIRGTRPDQATIDDVAALAGLSRATAARALGSYGRVSKTARARVRAAAVQLKYRPNTLARSMITGSTHTLGVIVADIENPFFARAVRGISDRAHDSGFEVILANSDENVEKERAAVAMLLEKKVDGLIIAPAWPGEADHLREVIDAGVPVVLFDRSARIGADAVIVENERASHEAVTHLIGLGHRRIAVLTHRRSVLSADDLAVALPGPEGAMTNTVRLVGWAGALRAAGLPVTEDLIRGTGYDRGSAAEQTIAALEMPDPATAIFSTDNSMTLGAVEAITTAGRSMPRDVSLVAFDDLEWTMLVQPPLTVIRQPVYELGATATRRLLGRLAGDDGPPETIVLNTEFVIRGSTGPLTIAAGARPR